MTKVTNVRVTRFEMKRAEVFETSTLRSTGEAGFLLEVEADGAVGIGGTGSLASRMSGDELQALLEGPVRETLLGSDAAGHTRLLEQLGARKVHPRAAVAADLALHDLRGKLANLPCYALWGGAVRSSVAVIRMIGLKSPAELATAVRDLVDEGFKHVKVKIGTGLDDDLERVRLLRETFGQGLWIGVDANGAYEAEQAIALSRALEPYGVAVIEQPTGYKDLEALVRVTAKSAIPIMADQSVWDTDSALELCKRQAAHWVAVKATKMGSLAECRRVADICLAFGIRVHVGGYVTPKVMDVAQAHFACSLPGVEEECEVGEFLAVTGDPTEGVTIRDGRLELSTAPGFGVSMASVGAVP